MVRDFLFFWALKMGGGENTPAPSVGVGRGRGKREKEEDEALFFFSIRVGGGEKGAPMVLLFDLHNDLLVLLFLSLFV
jgi:hypothetical protein